ncbi:MAG: Hsp20 family protein [Desulfurococcales archaeon]|nr:Hsp20 family protein [Desulfurococcales archaeon]
MAGDAVDEFFSDVERALRRMRKLQREIESYFSRLFEGVEDLYEDRLRRLASDVEEPLVEIRDVGDEVVVIVDTSGMKDETIDIRVTNDSIIVSGAVDERKIEEALQGWYLAHRKKEFRGVYKLGYTIDPSTVKVEKRGSVLVIRAKKTPPRLNP